MFVLVTQADGSARRFTWLTYAIAACLAAAYVQQQPQQQAAFESAEQSRQEALAFLDENAYVVVEDQFAAVIPLDYAKASREAFFSERREQGFVLMPERLMTRGQDEFDQMLDWALAEISKLPAWKLGIRSRDETGANWIMHVAVHETQAGLVLALVLLLCLGIALEDAWGSIVFGCLALAGVVATAYASLSVGYVAATGMPWIGASGLIATLMGAYFVRSPPLAGSPRAFGMLPLPCWLLLPIWLGVEYMTIRGVSSSEQIAQAPVIVHSVGFGLGAFVSAVMLLLQVERRSLDRAQKAKVLVDNRQLERAMLLKEAGKAEPALELLRKEHRRSPQDRDVALALWDVSTQLGKASGAVAAMLSVIESDLQTNSSKQLVQNWFALVDEVTDLPANPQLYVRTGEVLLEAGHSEAALAAMTRAVEGSKPLTSALARRIVRSARELDPELTRHAAEIALADRQLDATEREELTRLCDKPPPDTPRTAAATVEAKDPAARLDVGSEQTEDLSALDPQALRLDELEEELQQGLDDTAPQEDWNTPGLIEDLSDELDGAFEELDDEDLIAAATEAGIFDDTVTVVNISRPAAEPQTTVTEVELPAGTDDETTTAVNIAPMRRTLKIRDAVPIALESEAIVIEVDGGNKTRLPYSRIDAIAAAAIKGLAAKPVVVIDLIVNWQAASEPLKVVRLRSDRFDPSRLTEGAANQLEAFRTLITNLVQFSSAVPLPNFNAATGAPFQVYPGLTQYNLEVLDGIEALDS